MPIFGSDSELDLVPRSAFLVVVPVPRELENLVPVRVLVLTLKDGRSSSGSH